MKHLIRAGALVLALIVVIVLLRVIPVPVSFESYGFYRDHTIEEQWANKPLQYSSPDRCQDCHQENFDQWEKTEHSNVSCENCHGPGELHIENQVQPFMDISREACGVCHDSIVARPDSFPQINVETHQGKGECLNCHNPHNPWIKLLGPDIPHDLAGREDCHVCHDPGTLLPFPSDHQGRSLDDCQTCHAKTQTVKPVGILDIKAMLPKIPHALEGRGDCLDCHNTGSFKPFPATHEGRTDNTCQACHEEASLEVISSVPEIPHTLAGRNDCLICHNTDALKPYPSDHEGRNKDDCQICHAIIEEEVKSVATPEPTETPQEPPAVPAAHLDSGCQMCHKQGIGGAPKWPGTHAVFSDQMCGSCHQGGVTEITPEPTVTPVPTQTPKPTATPVPTDTPEPTETPQGPPAVPAAHFDSGCQMCHEQGIGGAPKWPGNHTGFSEQMCASCHQAIVTKVTPEPTETPAATVAVPEIPHDLTGRDDCLVCHNTSAFKPFPADHDGRNNEDCQTCHTRVK